MPYSFIFVYFDFICSAVDPIDAVVLLISFLKAKIHTHRNSENMQKCFKRSIVVKKVLCGII